MLLCKYDDKVNFKLCVKQIYQKGKKNVLCAMLQERPGHSGLTKWLTIFSNPLFSSVVQNDRLKFPVPFLRHLTDYKNCDNIVRK